MTPTVTVLAFLVAAAAAVRSTWSPCGLSMLSTITPFAERAKGHRYGATCAWFTIGAVLGGTALGGVTAGLATLTRAIGPGVVAVGSVGLVAALVVLVSDTGVAGLRLPVHYRQVNERWLDAYRPWVYGAGFGFQIGTGLATYITTGAVYLLVVLGALTGDPLTALAVGAAFGLIRGLAVTLTRRITSPTGLIAFHQRFAALRPWADRLVVATVLTSALACAVGVGVGPAVVGTAVVATVTLVTRAALHLRPRRASTQIAPGLEGGAEPGSSRSPEPSVAVG